MKTQKNKTGIPAEPSNQKDPENIKKKKSLNEDPRIANEINFGGIVTGIDLDVPGSELDDQQEDIGSEDEENNYYSMGGDNHNNLEEDNG